MPRPSRLSLKMMETFLTIIECDGNASEAADRFGINQPSMSKRLAEMQHKHPQMRFAWLRREGKLWELTDEGKRILPAVKEIVRLSRLVQGDVEGRIDEAPQVSLACGQLAAQTFVRDAMLEFRRKYPKARIRLATPRGHQRIQGVETGLYDLSIVSHDEGDIEERYGRLVGIESLFDDPWVLVCAQKAPAAIKRAFEGLPKRKVSIEHLSDLPLILPETDSGVRRQLEQSIIRQGQIPNLQSIVQTGGWSALIQFVLDGFGIGLVTQHAIGGVTGLQSPRPLESTAIDTPQVKMIYQVLPESMEPNLDEHGLYLRECLIAACSG